MYWETVFKVRLMLLMVALYLIIPTGIVMLFIAPQVRHWLFPVIGVSLLVLGIALLLFVIRGKYVLRRMWQ